MFEVADTFYKYGGEVLFVDEVHKYPQKYKNSDWSREMKAVYDSFPSLQVFYTGSSVLELHQGQGDLSRRKVNYSLQGLSFREYILFYHQVVFPIIDLDDILRSHSNICKEVTDKIKELPAYEKKLKTGY